MSQTRRGFLIGVFGGMLYGVLDRVRSTYASTESGLFHSKNRDLWGKVVLAKDIAIRKTGDLPDIDRTRMLLDKAVEKLTGVPAPDGWRTFFHPKDKVALKINSLGGKSIATHPNVASALAGCLVGAGLKPYNIVIWDRSSRELERAGYEINTRGEGPLCFGTDKVGYEPFPRVHGTVGSCFSPILTKWASALIDVPVLKDHDISGVSLSMKNLFGVIHNPNKYHGTGCDPYLADLLEHPSVKDKFRLSVCDAHRAQYQGGPAYVAKWSRPYGGYLVAADPVALDTVGTGIIEERRRSLGLPSLEEAGRPPVHLKTAHERGLGEGRMNAIDRIEIES